MEKLLFSGKLKDSIILLGESLDNLSKYLNNNKTLIITDSKVADLYSKRFPAGKTYIIENAEQQKNLETASNIYTFLLRNEFDRASFILGIGGGAICDIAGFVASTFMRGIGFGFVPTTLLAQVDASIGGKNGVNFNNFKNMVGTFNQPDFILSDPALLNTLEKKELRNGFAETIKHALIKDPDFVQYIISNKNDLINLKEPFLSEMIKKSVKIKLDAIEFDERETGERKKLNFGHTIGHAIEIEQNLSHGEAISIGMVFAALLSYKMDLLNKDSLDLIKKLIESFNLPTILSCDKKTLINNIKRDKKRNKDKIDFVLLNKLGGSIIKKIDFQMLETLTNDLCSS